MTAETTDKETRRISLRQVTPEDANLLVEIYASTRADELALVPWTEEQKRAFVQMQSDAQHDHYKSTYPQAQYSVVVVNERSAGRLYLAENEAELRILDLSLIPEQRNQGIGTCLLQNLIETATEKQKALRMYVEGFNPALRLLERLGFLKLEENGIYFLMERPPSTMGTAD